MTSKRYLNSTVKWILLLTPLMLFAIGIMLSVLQYPAPKLKHYCARRLLHVLKLSMVASIDRSSSLVLDRQDFERAKGWLRWQKKTWKTSSRHELRRGLKSHGGYMELRLPPQSLKTRSLCPSSGSYHSS